VNRDDVIAALQPDEPDYPGLARFLGADATPVLLELVRGENMEFASKAASLAGFLRPEVGGPLLAQAAVHLSPTVRVAAAASLERQPQAAAELGGKLLTDSDVGVRKSTLQSLRSVHVPELQRHVEALAATEQVAELRRLAIEVAQQLHK
jgi:hypothetical protein